MTRSGRLSAEKLQLGYGDKVVVDDVTLSIPDGQLTVIIGPNGCGKSTLLKGFGRLLTPMRGQVCLDGHRLQDLETRHIATQMSLLPQTPVAPDGITVEDLVTRGRHPHQRWFRRISPADREAVDEALETTGVADLASRPIHQLSGGQRQRVWIAMALAQQTDIMLLDEPTTHLDLAHQLSVLELVARLQREGRTIVVVLHELALAARYATHLVAMHHGSIVAEGPPGDVLTESLLADAFNLTARVRRDEETDFPIVLPLHHCS